MEAAKDLGITIDTDAYLDALKNAKNRKGQGIHIGSSHIKTVTNALGADGTVEGFIKYLKEWGAHFLNLTHVETHKWKHKITL